VAVPDRPLDLDRIAAGITEGLKALGETLSHARPVADGPQVPARIESLSHELEMIHSTLVTLKDLSAQQRDHLRNAQDLLAARAKQGTVEVEVTQEMLANEHAFMERLHQVLERAQKPKSTPPSP
jgi:hypothetical protein